MKFYKDEDKFAYEVLKTFALTHNYNSWIISLLKNFLAGRVLEVGSGTGNLTFYLSQLCEELVCVDKSDHYVQHLKIDYPNISFYCIDIADTSIFDILNRESFDTIVCVNVLEHIENDMLALKNMLDLLKKGGKLLLFVPALSWLYGTFDRKVKHYRRYNKQELVEKVKRSGFIVKEVRYHNFIGIFGWYLNAKILKRTEFPIIQPLIYDKLVPVISKIEEKFKLPLGMSLFLVAEK
jgi:SAM-dependent methyltransferase